MKNYHIIYILLLILIFIFVYMLKINTNKLIIEIKRENEIQFNTLENKISILSKILNTKNLLNSMDKKILIEKVNYNNIKNTVENCDNIKNKQGRLSCRKGINIK